MKNRLLLLVAGTCICSAAVAAATLPDSESVDVKMRAQETQYWCWAASGQMVMESLGKSVSQCEQANQRFKRTDCCDSPTPRGCIDTGWPQFDRHGFSFKRTARTALSWDELRDEIAAKRRPFAFSWEYNDGGGHMMIAHGFLTAKGKQYVSVLDPLPVKRGAARDIPYAEYVKGPRHKHWDDFYAVAATRVAASQPDSKPSIPSKSFAPKLVAFDAAIHDSLTAAQKMLDTYRELRTLRGDRNARDVSLMLGDPFPMVWIGLRELREAPDAKAQPLLRRRADRILYPILSADRVLAGVVLQLTSEGWEEASYGDSYLTRLLVETREKYRAMHRISSSDFHVVSIPALNTYLLGVRREKETELIPLIAEESLGAAGKAQSPAELLSRLVEAAIKHDGMPR